MPGWPSTATSADWGSTRRVWHGRMAPGSLDNGVLERSVAASALDARSCAEVQDRHAVSCST